MRPATERNFFLSIYKNEGGEIKNVLSGYYERHKVDLDYTIEPLNENFNDGNLAKQYSGVVLEMAGGLPGRGELNYAKQLLKKGMATWFYWPAEETVEYIDQEKLWSYWRHWLYIKLISTYRKAIYQTRHIYRTLCSRLSNDSSVQKKPKTPLFYSIQPYQHELDNFIQTAVPVDIQSVFTRSGIGAYLRQDFWVSLKAGGSYGHTCYVWNELNKINKTYAFMPNCYELLNKLGCKQVLLGIAGLGIEENLVMANDFYYPLLKVAFDIVEPVFIYERLCLGNYVGARLSQELKIPYIVEYNGSEIIINRSFGNQHYQYEHFYLSAEEAAFKQASVISVISDVVRDELLERGVSPDKILVNPNGADASIYHPVSVAEKINLRKQYQLDETHIIVGFIGTFGGWHGIDTLAAAIPIICQQNSAIRFLLIGAGHYLSLITKMVEEHNLSNQVILTGLVPQSDAVSLLQMCDIYLSPQSNNMHNTKFFGSPTKLFEYMALGGAIVASNLMQIGEILSPCYHGDVLPPDQQVVNDERAILCTPGSVEQFVNAVLFLAKNSRIRIALGNNARKALVENYTWEQHVARLFDFMKNKPVPEPKKIVTEIKAPALEYYKSEVQNQWDNNPCGSHFAKKSQKHTAEWFKEVEEYRYKTYAPWMPKEMQFSDFKGKYVLEIGGGIGTDLSQFAQHGAIVVDLDMSRGHLNYARENFNHRNLAGQFYQGDAEKMPFPDNTFDVVYSNGVIHHSPHTQQIVEEIFRVLKPGGIAKIMVYAENSLHYWRNLILHEWLNKDLLHKHSIGEIMSRTVEITENSAKPLVKVYTRKRLARMFKDFNHTKIIKRQMTPEELPSLVRWLPVNLVSKFAGWNLVLTAQKPGVS